MIKEIEEYLTNNFFKAKISSKDIKSGDVFIALAGKNNHGNIFIDEALYRGAKYIITDKKVQNKIINKNILLVKDVIFFLLKIAKHKRSLFNGKVIAITGSVGKTSVKENLNYFLSIKYNVSISIKSYNNYLGVLISLININLESDFAIFEIGTNNFFEIRKLTSIIMPSQIIITNIYPTHLEKLINTRNIAIEKSDIFRKKYNPFIDLVIVPNNNIDEEFIISEAQNENIKNIISFGSGKNSNLKINMIEEVQDNILKVNLIFDNKKINFLINKNQKHKINNFLICVIIFNFNKIDYEVFCSLTKKTPLIEGRGLNNHIIFNNKKINFIDESYNASPETMKLCVNFFEEINVDNGQKKFLILGDMKELGVNKIEYHVQLLKHINSKKIFNVIVCGELMRLSLNKVNSNKIMCIMDLKLIFLYLENNLDNNDIILIKGSNSSLTRKLSQKLLRQVDND